MRIVEGADWRDGLAFETPMRVAELAPGDPARCALCGPDAALLPRDELWATKHHHPNRPAGHVRFSCAMHTPKPAPAPAPETRAPQKRTRAAAAPRRAPVVEAAPRPVCPTCFVEVPPTGVCGMCGERIV